MCGNRDSHRLNPSVLLREPPSALVDELLRECPGGLSVGELQEFLEDPLSDPKVGQDEKSRSATVEHIKQLRDRVWPRYCRPHSLPLLLPRPSPP